MRYEWKRALFSKFRAIQTWNPLKLHANLKFLHGENVKQNSKGLLGAGTVRKWLKSTLVATVQNRGKYAHLGCYVVDVSRSAGERVFLFSCERLGRVCRKLLSLVFWNFQNGEYHINRSHMEIWSSEVIKFCKRKLFKRRHFMSPLKMINLFQDMMPNFSPKTVGLEISRPAIFMINFWGSI